MTSAYEVGGFGPGIIGVRTVMASALVLCCFHSLSNTQTFRRALTASVDSCAEIKSGPSGKRCSECAMTSVHVVQCP